MALFKIYEGGYTELPSSYVEGYAYFCSDTGELFIDTGSTAADRIQVNAEEASKLVKRSNTGVIEWTLDEAAISNLFRLGTANKIWKTDSSGVPGWRDEDTTATKLGTATVGSGANPIYLNEGVPTVSNSTVGSTSRPVYMKEGTLTGIAALGVEYGGTAATTAAGARTSLSVYSKTEVDNLINNSTPVNATSKTYTAKLAASSWSSSSPYTYTLAVDGLKAYNAPTIHPSDNSADVVAAYGRIYDADVSAGQIVFTASAKPTVDINITITDIL